LDEVFIRLDGEPRYLRHVVVEHDVVQDIMMQDRLRGEARRAVSKLRQLLDGLG
jgi:hypothetical protein